MFLRIILPTLLFCLCLILPLTAGDSSLKIVLNMWNDSVYPANFRQCPDLNASASAQYSEKSLKKMLKKIPSEKVILIDLRQESHGFFGGMAVGWYGDHNWANLGKTAAQAEADEKAKLAGASNQSLVLVYHDKKIPFPVYVSNVSTEREIVTRCGAGYHRFAVSDHRKPSDNDVNEFIAFVKNIPEDTWLHFHCSAGIGRATTFLTMLDMMHNAGTMTCQEIIDRQVAIGGKNLLKDPKPGHWKYEHARDRKEFIERFHRYSNENPTFDQTWSKWLTQQADLE